MHPGIDETGLNTLLHDPVVVNSNPAHYKQKIGQPLVAFKYGTPIGVQWHNTKRFAHMSEAELDAIRNAPFACHLIPDKYKASGHLRTADPEFCSTPNSRQACAMGSKFRLGAVSDPIDSTARSAILSSLTSAVTDFARKSEDRVGMKGCMQEWRGLVLARLQTIVAAIPEGLCTKLPIALSFTRSDELAMRGFL